MIKEYILKEEAFGTAIGTAASIGMGIGNNLFGAQLQEDARRENYLYNERAALNADARTRALYKDFYSPEALMRQYKNAGLSPSMMFGGTPGQGGTNGAQGGGPNGPAAIYTPISMMEGAQIANLLAQTEKTKAETRTIEGENDRGSAEIQNIKKDTELKLQQAGATQANKFYTETLTEYQNLVTSIKEQTGPQEIRLAEYQANTMLHNSVRALWEAKHEQVNVKFDLDTYTERVETIAQQLINLVDDDVLKKRGVDQIEAAIKQAWRKLEIDEWATNIMDAKNEIDWRKFEDGWTYELEKFAIEIAKEMNFKEGDWWMKGFEIFIKGVFSMIPMMGI